MRIAVSEWAPLDRHGDADEHPADEINAGDHPDGKLEPFLKRYTRHGADRHERTHRGDADVGNMVKAKMPIRQANTPQFLAVILLLCKKTIKVKQQFHKSIVFL